MNQINDIVCRSCGYSLQGLIDDRCPECGLVFDRTDARTFRTGKGRMIGAIISAMIALFVALAMVMFLMKRPAIVPPKAPTSTPLNSAAKAGDLPLVQDRIDKGDDVNTQLVGDMGTALINAASNSHDEVVALLIGKGADPDMTTSQGPAILHAAHSSNDKAFKTVEVLIRGGANVDGAHRQWGYTALHRAVRFKSPKTVKLLLDNGADPTLQDSKGRTALDWAKSDKNQQMITILEEAIASGDKSENEK